MNMDQYNQCCAVCGGPGEPHCNCEGERLQQCIHQAEKVWIESWMKQTREWATNQAINAVTAVFNKKKEARKVMFEAQLSSIPYWPQYQQYRGRPPLHPQIIADIQRRMAEADQNLKRGIDHDWKTCVVRYQDVLTHFYSQVKINHPREPESPFGNALAGGGAPRPPSVVNLPRGPSVVNMPRQPPPPPPPASIMRSATVPPKKARRTSKVNMDLDGDFMDLLTNQLEGLSRTSTIGASRKSATPAPQASTPAPRSQRPGSKRRESRDFSLPRGMGGMGMPPPPPHVPQPPMNMNQMNNMNFSNQRPASVYDSFR